MFLESEIMASFISNKLALHIAAFGRIDFENGDSMVLDYNPSDEDAFATQLMVSAGGNITERRNVFGMPAQAYELCAYLAQNHAIEYNTKVVLIPDNNVDES